MSATAAVGIIHRRAEPADRAGLAAAYADQHLSADAAAAAGFVDEIIEPSETRARLVWALGTLAR
jgi:acetyl-CoA carboxylase carboxyltransferase component